MVWIRTTHPDDAHGELAQVYRRLGIDAGSPDQILLAHSERPHTLEGHMALYRSVLHHRGNSLELGLVEAIGVLVSLLNGCGYCVTHHRRGLARALGDETLTARWCDAIERRAFDGVFDAAQSAALDYAVRLTLSPAEMEEEDIDALRRAGWRDGDILEINQVAAYFAYANRTVLGLGVQIEEG